jgi:DNA-binding IclR family transcriptional regulator
MKTPHDRAPAAVTEHLSLDASSPTGAQSVDRAMLLLTLIGAEGRAGATLQQLSEQTNLPKPTCRRLLLALVRANIRRAGWTGSRYWIGAGLVDLAHQSGNSRISSEPVRQQMRVLLRPSRRVAAFTRASISSRLRRYGTAFQVR